MFDKIAYLDRVLSDARRSLEIAERNHDWDRISEMEEDVNFLRIELGKAQLQASQQDNTHIRFGKI
jgi:hypothetical protein